MCWVEGVGWGRSRSPAAAWSAMFLSPQRLPSCKYLHSILWEAWVFTANACGSSARACVCASVSNAGEMLLLVLAQCKPRAVCVRACVCVCRMRHFPWSLHSLLTLASGSCSGPDSELHLWINSDSRAERRSHLALPSLTPANDRERKMGEVFVYRAPPCIWGCGADITSLRVEHSHKTCFLYSIPNVNNTEGVNTIKGPARPFLGKHCIRMFPDSCSPGWALGRKFHCGMVNEVHITWPGSNSVSGCFISQVTIFLAAL